MEEIVEIALAAAATALFVSGFKKLLPCILNQWPPFLFLLLNLVIASIVVVSIRLPNPAGKDVRCSSVDHRQRKKKKKSGGRELEAWRAAAVEEEEEEEEGDVEELNARAEVFIMTFRRQLWLDSFSSNIVVRREDQLERL